MKCRSLKSTLRLLLFKKKKRQPELKQKSSDNYTRTTFVGYTRKRHLITGVWLYGGNVHIA
jgi:hypothetical protein